MASTIGKVRAVFTASTSGLTAGVNSAAASMRRLEASVGSLRSGMSTLVAIQGTQLFASVVSGAASAARSLISMGAASAQAISASSDLAQRLGLTYGELAGLSNAADQFGVSEEQLGGAMTRLQVAFAKAAGGSAQATAAFRQIGISVADLNGMTARDQFEAIAEAIAKLPTEAERAAAAVSIFGRSGAALAPMFAQGAAGLRAASEEADKFGLALNNAQASDVKTMFNSFKDVQDAIQGVINQVTAYLAPAVTAIATAFTDMVGSIGGANIGQAIGDGILQGALYFAGVVDYFIAQGNALWSYASQVGGQLNAVWEFGNRVAAFFSGVFNVAKAVLFTVVGVFSSVFQGLATIAQKIGSYLGFDTSSLDAVVASAQAFNSTLDEGIKQSANQAAADFGAAFGQTQQFNQAGEAIAGPATKMIKDSIDAAREAANATSAAIPQKVDIKQTQTVDLAPVNEAVKGIDSRSREGVAEMFRLMRGGGGDIQEQQLGVLEQIAANTAPVDLEEPVAEFAF